MRDRWIKVANLFCTLGDTGSLEDIEVAYRHGILSLRFKTHVTISFEAQQIEYGFGAQLPSHSLPLGKLRHILEGMNGRYITQNIEIGRDTLSKYMNIPLSQRQSRNNWGL